MASTINAEESSSGAALLAGIARDGSEAAPQRARLLRPAAPLRDIADALHALCIVHGTHPDLMTIVRDRAPAPAAAAWLDRAADGFAVERAFLAHVVAAVGPMPSTPGQADTTLALASQVHALEMLARSDRHGCAVGAAVALALDWAALRPVLEAGAQRAGLAAAAVSRLPDAAACSALLDAVALSPATERALRFGMEQALAQHRGLWHLLEARASARAG